MEMEIEIEEEKNESVEKQEISATAQLLDTAFDLWLSQLLKGCFYHLTRTFAHHRLGEKYDTKLVFDALNLVNRGKHRELIEEINAYRKTLFDELDKFDPSQKTN